MASERARIRHGAAAVWGTLAVLLIAAVGVTDRCAERAAIKDLRQKASPRLDLYRSSLESALGRYDYLPAVLPLDADVPHLLRDPADARLAGIVNDYLQGVNDRAGASVVYLMDSGGTTLAASNWNDPASFVGRNFAYRPYFQDAFRRETARFYGIGTTSGEPGYYLARAVRDGQAVIGVAVVKVSLDGVERSWAPGAEQVLVSDDNGVVILSSRPSWKFTTIGAVAPDTLARLDRTRQYEGVTLRALHYRVDRELGDGAEIVSLAGPDAPAGAFLALSSPVGDSPWRITVLYDLAEVRS